MQRARPDILLAIAGLSLALGACATAPESRDDVLDSRLAGPCDRLILSWPEDDSRLRTLMGHTFEPRAADGVGLRQLNVLRCPHGRARQATLTFAFLSVPIAADSAPLVITQMPDDGWAWLPSVIADTDSAAVFSAMGYDTESAEIAFEFDASDNYLAITVQLIFASGRVSITASGSDQALLYTASHALVSTDPQYDSVFFGKETAHRYPSMVVDVEVQGELPLAAIDFGTAPSSAVFDSGLRLDRVFWRLPRGQP